MAKETLDTAAQQEIPETRDGSDYPPYSLLPIVSRDPKSDKVDSINKAISAISDFISWLNKFNSWDEAVVNRGEAIPLPAYVEDLIIFYIQGICDIQKYTYPSIYGKVNPLFSLELQIAELQKVLIEMGGKGIEIARKNSQLISSYMTPAQKENSLYLVTIGPRADETTQDTQEKISAQRKEYILKAIISQSPGICLLAIEEAMSIKPFFDDTKDNKPFSIQRLFGHTFSTKFIPKHYGLYNVLIEESKNTDKPIVAWLEENGVKVTVSVEDNFIEWSSIIEDTEAGLGSAAFGAISIPPSQGPNNNF